MNENFSDLSEEKDDQENLERAIQWAIIYSKRRKKLFLMRVLSLAYALAADEETLDELEP